MNLAGAPNDNRLLAALTTVWGSQIRQPHLQFIDLKPGQVLSQPRKAQRFAYFPTTAIVSLVYTTEAGGSAQIAVVGSEGMVGETLFLGGGATTWQATVLIAGRAVRIEAQAFRDEFEQSVAVRRITLRYTQALATQIAQTANDAIATVEGCSDEQWKAITTAEQWPVAVVACHLADLHDVFFQLIDAAKSNKSSLFELTQEDIDAVNADRARTRADVSKTEIIGRRRDTGPRLSALVAGLSDQELELVVGAISGYDLTIASFAELAVVGHYREHLASIRSAIGN